MIKKLIYNRKTVFVRAGGRNFRYSSYSIVSNGKNKIGFSKSKSKNIMESNDKSYKQAKKKMFKFIIKNNSFPFSYNFKTAKTTIKMINSDKDIGVIAGGCVKKIISYTGIKNVICKIYGSKNKYNVFNTVKKMFLKFKCQKKE
ncbi:hypothetical protein [Candidatus Vidania fulgoroideorum]